MKRTMWMGSLLVLLMVLTTASSAWCSLFSREMLGLESGLVHPFVSFSGEYTDNLFSTNDQEKDDFVSYITPGIWLALPGASAEVINIATMSSSPGGMAQTRFQKGDFGPYQAFLKYGPTFENYADYSERDFISHKLDAYAALNLRGGLSFELLDQYKDSRDGVEEETNSAEYNNNMVGLTTSYAMTEKLKARVDLGYYDVNYDVNNPDKDREDTSVAGYLFFAVMPKTSLFGQVSHVDIDYDSANKDSKELKVFGGVTYNPTDRIDAMFKLGMMSKKLDATDATHDSVALEGTLSYSLTDKVSFVAAAGRSNKETATSRFVTETSGSITGNYTLSSRLSSSLLVSLTDEDYNSIDREDVTVMVSPSVRYVFNNWFFGSLSYSYTDKSASGHDTSNQSDYTRNSVMLSVTASM